MAPFPSAVLAHRYPTVRNFGDFTKIERNDLPPVDLLVGGTPCQSFSVAGNRGGLDDARGNLSLEFARLARRIGARWILWENVPGVLSADGGLALEIILGTFRQCGYSLAWRILDAQHFGVPQRRRRLFVVGHLGDEWVAPAAVLLEPVGLPGDHPARGTAWESAPGSTGTRTPGSGVPRRDQPATGSGTGTRPGSDPSPAVTDALTGNPFADRGDGSDDSRLVVQSATTLAPSRSVVAALTTHPYGDQGDDNSRLVVQSGVRAHSGGDAAIVGTLLGGGETKRGHGSDHPEVAYLGAMPPPASGMRHVDGHTGIHVQSGVRAHSGGDAGIVGTLLGGGETRRGPRDDHPVVAFWGDPPAPSRPVEDVTYSPSLVPAVAGSVMMGSGQRNDPFTETLLIGHAATPAIPAGDTSSPPPPSEPHPSEYVPDRIMTMIAKWGKGSGGPAGDEHYNLVAHAINLDDAFPPTKSRAESQASAASLRVQSVHMNQRREARLADVMPALQREPSGTPGQGLPVILITTDDDSHGSAQPPASQPLESRYTAYGVADSTGALMAETHPYGFTGQDAYVGKLIPTFVSVTPSDGVPSDERVSDGKRGQLPMPFDLAQITSKLNYSQARPGDMVPPLNTVSQMHVVVDPPAEPPSVMTA
ncbi:MAG: DNA (cytosine-5-)-methyltransferase, partial [Actinobacteria bacterium]|nr:DNA (cytosine-5-)-methyltransferase [Actinomycetota bacterium]